MKAALPIYLDYNATTPVAPEVLAAMLPYLKEHFGNPSSSHPYGIGVRQVVLQAREAVAALIGAQTDELVFTGSATEANNLALLGAARVAPPGKRHLIVSAIEHPAVMAPAEYLKTLGWELTKLPVDGFGCIEPEDLRRALRPDTFLVSVMHANNEIGTIQPIAELAALVRDHGCLMHTDAAQSAGKVSLEVDELGVDLLTLAGHKFYAPKGVGALYIRRGTPIASILYGADQEHGLRPGTENVPHIVALGAAATLAIGRLGKATPRLRALRDALHARLADAVPGLVLNGHPEFRLPNTLHVSFPHVTGRALLAEAAPVVAASVGSACHSEGDAVSGVLAAIGIDAARAAGAIRLSAGWTTTMQDVERAADALIAAWRRLA
ncbi:MAG: cysteine desulfurase [Gammaproteobacteria bacterium]|nr:cysteine desulfurase [Gammaproteobacteria bacterium]